MKSFRKESIGSSALPGPYIHWKSVSEGPYTRLGHKLSALYALLKILDACFWMYMANCKFCLALRNLALSISISTWVLLALWNCSYLSSCWLVPLKLISVQTCAYCGDEVKLIRWSIQGFMPCRLLLSESSEVDCLHIGVHSAFYLGCCPQV